MVNKITLQEPPGPLRKGLKEISETLGDDNGGRVFSAAHDLANAGLRVVLDLEKQGLGNSDITIPPPLHSVRVQYRERGTDVSPQKTTSENELIPRL